MTKPVVKRCAIYTRKSSEEGLEQDFNSLHAQREACEAFIKSQQSEGWRLVSNAYDDGGISGGTMERPALRQLLADIAEGKVDVVVVYKVDRLTRSLADFAKMVEVFDSKGVSFVAVTQQFNTTSSMGRLTLNVLLSFAQFEREVTGERIRDKIAASKRKGIWMGGFVPLGYEVKDRKLLVVPEEAKLVREVFTRYAALKNVRLLLQELNARNIRRRSQKGQARTFSKGGLYKLLSNRIYIGEIPHKELSHPGQHEAIIDRGLWDSAQTTLANQAVLAKEKPGRKSAASPLMGKLFDESGTALTPTHAAKEDGRRYRYYTSRALHSGGPSTNRGWRLPAYETEQAISRAAQALLKDRGAVNTAFQKLETNTHDLRDTLRAADELVKELAGSSRTILGSVVERIDLKADGFHLAIRLSIGTDKLMLTRFVPMLMKRRGVELKMIMGGAEEKGRADPILLGALGKAHRWFEAVKAGKLVPDIAREEGIGLSYVRRVLQLAFLAPSIVEAIINGSQPADLNTQKLVFSTRLDPDWNKQRRQLGFP